MIVEADMRTVLYGNTFIKRIEKLNKSLLYGLQNFIV